MTTGPMTGSRRVETVAGPHALALAGPRVTELLGRIRDVRVQLAHDEAGFLGALAESRPRIALISTPPATTRTIEEVASIRRRRVGLRAVYLNDASGIPGRLHALEIGFDEALSDDVPADELAGRLWILARQPRSERDRLTVCDGTELDLATCELIRDGRSVHLRPKEFGLLEVLARHPGRVFSRGQLLNRVWGTARDGDPRTIDVHMRWLRAKVEPDPDRPVHLVTVRGLGYRLDPDAPSPAA